MSHPPIIGIPHRHRPLPLPCFFPQAQHPIWACSHPLASKLPTPCGPAPEGLWACPFGELGQPASGYGPARSSECPTRILVPFRPLLPMSSQPSSDPCVQRQFFQGLGVPPLQIFQYLYRYWNILERGQYVLLKSSSRPRQRFRVTVFSAPVSMWMFLSPLGCSLTIQECPLARDIFYIYIPGERSMRAPDFSSSQLFPLVAAP